MLRLTPLLLLVFLSSCISYKPVLITGISDVKTQNLGGDKIELGLNLEIYNPNGFKMVLKEYNMDVTLNDKVLGKAMSMEKISIKRRTKASYAFKLNADYADFMAASISGLGALFNSEPVTFKIKGRIKGRIWWFRKNIPIETVQKVKL